MVGYMKQYFWLKINTLERKLLYFGSTLMNMSKIEYDV